MKPVAAVVVLSLALAAARLSADDAASPPAAPHFGESQGDLLFTPVTPCRILDTRLAGGIVGAGSTRNFMVTGTDLSAQGGNPAGCGIPDGPTTAAVINFVAVDATGAGDFRITPFGTPMPLASFLNYANIPGSGLNIANGVAVAICDSATASCASDFTIQADVSAAHLVADVMGYFRTTNGTVVGYEFAQTSAPLSLASTIPFDDTIPQISEGNELLAVTITPRRATSLLVFDGTVNWSEPANHSEHMTVAIFRDGTTSALATATDSAHNADGRCSANGSYPHICTMPIRFTMAAGTTATTTFRMRVGLNGGIVHVNQAFNGRRLGGSLYSTFSVTEIAR